MRAAALKRAFGFRGPDVFVAIGSGISRASCQIDVRRLATLLIDVALASATLSACAGDVDGGRAALVATGDEALSSEVIEPSSGSDDLSLRGMYGRQDEELLRFGREEVRDQVAIVAATEEI